MPKLGFARSIHFLFLALISFAFTLSATNVKAQTGEGYGGWVSDAGPSGYFKTAREACQAQKDLHNPNWQSRLIGAMPVAGNPNTANCSWTQFQYLCPEETGYGINGCGTTFPSYVDFRCAPGYKPIAGKTCVLDPIPERDCGAGVLNPQVGNPINLSTGCKVVHAEDYATADGQLNVSRSYRALPIGNSVSFQTLPAGLASNWTFDFAFELQLGGFAGTPSAPDAKMALVDPNGTAQDFEMQSGGAIVPNTATGEHFAPKNTKIEFVGTLPASLLDVQAAPSQWKMTDPDDTVWTFLTFQRPQSGTYNVGRPISKVTKTNYRWDFAYAADGALQNITDSFGRQMVFSWDYFYVSALPSLPSWPSAVKSIALPDGTSLRYTYDPPPAATAPSTSQIERLVKVERLDAASAVLRSNTYAYADARFPWHLTSIARTDGTVTNSYAYDARGRGTSTSLAGGVDQYSVAYSETPTDQIRTVTGPLGKIEEYKFQKFASGTPDHRFAGINGQSSTTTPASTSSLSYGTNALISGAVDEEGRAATFTRDTKGRATSIVEALGTSSERTTGVTYHPTLNMPTQEVRPGLTVDYTYDAQGKLLTRTETDTTTHTVPYSTAGQTRTTTYSWAATGRLLSINGPLPATGGKDDTLTFTYHPTNGNLLTSTNGLGHVTTFAGHDANGRPGTMTDPNGIITAFTYDALGRTTVINVKHPTTSSIDAITTLEYDSQDRVIGITAPATDKLIIDYNVAGQVTAIRAASGERIDYVVNGAGGVTSETVKRSDATIARQTARTFDNLGRMLTETLGTNRTTTWAYDKVGNPTQVVSARNNATVLAFDPLNRLVSTTLPGGGSEGLGYNPLDDITSSTDAISVATTFIRNGFGEVIQEVSPDRGTSIYYYDAAGRVSSAIDGRGQRIDYARDVLGRVLSATPVGRPASEIISYVYDDTTLAVYQKGRLSKVIDASGTTTLVYDHRGNLLVKRQPVGTTTSAPLKYIYDLADRIIEIIYPSGRLVGYVRDSKGRVATVRTKATATTANWTNVATGISYEAFGSLTSATLGNTLTMTSNWGNDGRLAQRRLKTSTAVNRSLLQYTYDNDDNITGITDAVTAANSVTYAYDVRGRLSRVTAAATSTGTYKREDLAYDANGNRTSVQRRINATDVNPTQTDTYARTSGTNRLASLSSFAGTRSFSYDNRGNTSAETRPSSISVTTAYDGHGRLTSYTRTGEATQSNVYNGLDQRVTVTSGTTIRRFVYAPDGRVIGGATGVAEQQY